MTFVGIMEGAKAVWYYNARRRNIKVSRNVAFAEQEELKEVVILGLSLEEETQMPVPKDLPKQEGKSQPPKSPILPLRSTSPALIPQNTNHDNPILSPLPSPTLDTCSLRPHKDINYHKSNNPTAH